MSYFLASDQEPITLRALVESIESTYLKYADYDLSGYVEFGIAVAVFFLGIAFIQGCSLSAWDYLKLYSSPFITRVKKLASAIDLKDVQKSKKIMNCTWYILGIIYYLLRMLFTILLYLVLLSISCAMVWYSGKYFVQLL
jgi:hypothetical protein